MTKYQVHRGILLGFSEFILDVNPKNWIKPFQRKSIWYLVLMAFFYHGISMGLMYAGDNIVAKVLVDYEAPSFPVSVTMAATSGPIEEILFFGIPYYLSGNPHSMLVTGAIWSAAHIFNTQVFSYNSLGYVGFLITIPHIFFSLRAWSSGKGWFAILFHSAWNLAFLLSYCAIGIRDCAAFGQGEFFVIDMFALGLTGSLLSIISLLRSKNKIAKTKFKLIMIFSIVVFVVSEIVINLKYAEFFFS